MQLIQIPQTISRKKMNRLSKIKIRQKYSQLNMNYQKTTCGYFPFVENPFRGRSVALIDLNKNPIPGNKRVEKDRMNHHRFH
jgi:hypothetical protein